jgi:hypothetical protein
MPEMNNPLQEDSATTPRTKIRGSVNYFILFYFIKFLQEESVGSPEGTQESAEIEPASVPDMEGRNTCMGAKLPWDPFLFGQPAGATEAAASTRHLLFKGERPMVDNNPNRCFKNDLF